MINEKFNLQSEERNIFNNNSIHFVCEKIDLSVKWKQKQFFKKFLEKWSRVLSKIQSLEYAIGIGCKSF